MPGRPFTKRAARTEHKAKAEQTVDGRTWYAPRRAARYIGRIMRQARAKGQSTDQSTLRLWEKCCPWLDGQGIETRQLSSGYRRIITYYAKDGPNGLDAVKAAIARRPLIPAVPNYVYVGDARQELGWSVRTLDRHIRAKGAKVKHVSAKSKDGRALPRSYVSREFVDECKAEKPHETQMTAQQAATRLRVKRFAVHNLIAAGYLAGEVGRGVTTAKARGAELRYRRKATLVDRADVERLRDAMTGLPAGNGPRAGRPPLRLRRAAEWLHARAQTNGHAPAATSTPPNGAATRARRGRKQSEETKRVRQYCHEQLAAGIKATIIARDVNRLYGRHMSRKHVYTEASRYQRPQN